MTAHQFTSTSIRQLSETSTFDTHWPKITEAISSQAHQGAHEAEYVFPVKLQYWRRLSDALKNHGFNVQPKRKVMGRWGEVTGLKIKWA